jgi:hypothetical protein
LRASTSWARERSSLPVASSICGWVKKVAGRHNKKVVDVPDRGHAY